MIEGIGIDVVEVSRVQRAIDSWGNVFLGKIFTPQELDYARSKKNPTPHIAARFAVKEAVAKALATGWSGGFRWKDVEVENDAAGKPAVVLYGRVKELLHGSRVLVSISHSENVVVACAVIEGPGR
jgi:holo-[acyl-carrier protein] synthase